MRQVATWQPSATVLVAIAINNRLALDFTFASTTHSHHYRDSEIRLRCGPDASLYLGLQRYLIVLLCVFTFLSLVVILPVNYFSGDNGMLNATD